MTEDKVRDKARGILGLQDGIKGVKADVGQLTTFNQLGFEGISDKPDGWYLPDNANDVAVILETKASKYDLQQQKFVDELKKTFVLHRQNIQK